MQKKLSFMVTKNPVNLLNISTLTVLKILTLNMARKLSTNLIFLIKKQKQS